jgi:GntR family transcriptional regulator, carbon starvation induced regulator
MSTVVAISDSNAGPKRTLATAAYDRLRHDILHCILHPGERLRLHQLADNYDFGVGSLREALCRLVGDGLVVAEEQRGFSVTPLSHESLFDLLRMRLLFEEHGIRESIKQGGVDWEVGVMSAFHRLVKGGNRTSADPRLVDPEWERCHAAFHYSLVAGCNSPLLLQMREAVYAQGDRYRHFYLTYVAGKRDHLDEHRMLMEAALRRDADETVRLIQIHLETTVNSLLGYGMPGTKSTKRSNKKQRQ